MRRKLLSLIVAALLLSPLPALAQSVQTATLTGTVTDTTGAVLPGATVTVPSDSLIGGTPFNHAQMPTAGIGFRRCRRADIR